jgi:uncharacterized protein (TIGR03083 family)
MYTVEAAMMDLIAPERRALADALEALTPEQWQGETMCAGWTAGHVLAHLTMPFRISGPDFMAGLQECGGDFTTYSDRVADRDSQIPQAELVAVLRDNAENPWSPPGGGLAGALSHDVIHGLDITWPARAEYPIPEGALTAVLESIISPGPETHFGVPIKNVRISATDLDWTCGDGAPLAGRARDLILLLAARRVPQDRFSGDGLPVVTGAGTR